MSELKITLEGDSGTGKGLLAKELKNNLERGAWKVTETKHKDGSIILDANLEPVPKTHPDHQQARKFLVDYVLAQGYLSYIEIIQFRLNNDVNNDYSKVQDAIKIVFPGQRELNHHEIAKLLGMKLPTNKSRMKLHDTFWKSDVYKVLYDYHKSTNNEEK